MSRTHRNDSPYLSLAASSPVLSREAELELAREYRATGSQDAADRLVRSMLRYVVTVALKYKGYGFQLSDLIAEGTVGVLHALKKFDPERGHRFVTFASYWIRAEIVTYILRSRSLVRSGAPRPKVLFKLRRESNEVATQYGDTDEAKDVLAERMGVSRADLETLLARLNKRDVSLNAPRDVDGSEMIDFLSDEVTRSPEEEVADSESYRGIPEAVRAAVSQLNERERLIVETRLMATPEDELTLAELGRRLNVSRERVRQIEARTKAKLRMQLQGSWERRGIAA